MLPDMFLLPWSQYTVACTLLGYLCLVRLFRRKRYEEVHSKYAHKIHELTPQEAQNVMLLSSLWDMPGLYNYAVSFALFKTYAIPSISRLLLQTNELGSAANISKRYADTEILISTWSQCPISGIAESLGTELDPRAAIALARVNWLHSKYSISNDDFLYTMCLFILEPIDWAERYGWRPLSPLECQAHFVFWVEIGNHMNIKDIPESLDDLRAWSTAYEEEYMMPATSNRDVAQHTTNELLHAVPESFGLKSFCRRLTICLLDERVRIAMMQPMQGWPLHALVKGVMHTVKYIHRYLSLPRLRPLTVLGKPSTTTGRPRLYPTRWQAKPWYKSQSNSLLDRFAVLAGLYDDLPGPKYKCEGYRLEEMGPIATEKSGHEEVMRMAAEILGCPITGPWSLELDGKDGRIMGRQ